MYITIVCIVIINSYITQAYKKKLHTNTYNFKTAKFASKS